jgi:hypothetical protein
LASGRGETPEGVEMSAGKSPAFPLKGCGIRGAKKARHKQKGHGENGRIKSKSCQATWLHRSVCRVSRAYTWKEYPSIMQSIDKKSGDKRASVSGLGDAKVGMGKRANNFAVERRALAL